MQTHYQSYPVSLMWDTLLTLLLTDRMLIANRNALVHVHQSAS